VEDFKNRKSYQAILAAAKALFWKFGIKRVSVEEVCKHAGVSKMTFYRMFKNKSELVVLLLSTWYGDSFEKHKLTMASSIPFHQKIKELIVNEYEASQDISQEFLADIYNSDDPELQKLTAELTEQGLSQTRKDFEVAQKNGDIRKDIKMDSIFFMMEVIHEKVQDPRFLALHNNPQEAILELINFFFYGILTTNQKQDA
jgi:AcrR family transcriptional regulator